MGDLFPMLTKFNSWQLTEREHRHMYLLSHKEELVRAKNELLLYRKRVELAKDSVKCADLVEYLEFQKCINMKIATSTMAETAILDRRLELAIYTMRQIQLCLDMLKELVDKLDLLYAAFLREVARLMNFERPKDIIDRHTTLRVIKQESLYEFHRVHTKLLTLREKDAGVKEERLKKSLVLYNRKRELFQEFQELAEKNAQLSSDVKIWESNSNTTQRIVIQATCHIQEVYKRLLSGRKFTECSKPKTNVLEMLDEISKEIKKKVNTLETIASGRSGDNRYPFSNNRKSLAYQTGLSDTRVSISLK